MIIMTNANGRIGLEYAQAATHDMETDWNVVGSSCTETTTANGREMVNLCNQAGLCLGNTWRNGDPTAFTPIHRLDYIAFGQEHLDVADLLRAWQGAPV